MKRLFLALIALLPLAARADSLGKLADNATTSTQGRIPVYACDAGTLSGTVLAEVSYDSGVTYATAFTLTFSGTNSAMHDTIPVAAGATHARLRVSAYTSGATNCNVRSVNQQSVLSADSVGVVCNGAPGTPVVISITAGADASGTLTKGVRYLVTNDAGGTVFCKAGATATAGTDVPYVDQSTRCHLFSSASEADVVYHCAAAAAVTGKVYFIPMTGKGL